MKYADILRGFREEGRLRAIPPHRKGEPLIDLCTNDYMGLGARGGEFREEFMERFGDAAFTASASRLLASDQKYFLMLEDLLSSMYGRPALLFNSGYHANVGIISALNTEGTLWATDKLIHASAIDGLSMRGAESKRWHHNDVGHLRRILESEHDRRERIVVVCESVYSMDGDKAPLRELAALKREFPKMLLYVDEAHGFGCFGPKGTGLCAQENILSDVDILVGTLGKACASAGAFAVTSPLLKEYLVNTARSLIFSTSLPPVNAAWTILMIEKLSAMDAERQHLEKISARFRGAIEEITGVDNPSRSAIIPWIKGDAEKVIGLSEILRDAGILALPIRRPTVPAGGERIRFSLNAGLSDATLRALISTLRTLA